MSVLFCLCVVHVGLLRRLFGLCAKWGLSVGGLLAMCTDVLGENFIIPSMVCCGSLWVCRRCVSVG